MDWIRGVGRLQSAGIVCFGDATHGELGTNTFDETSHGPALIQGTAGAGSFDTGGDGFVCFIRDGDGVYCWGVDDRGQLGDGASAATLPTLAANGPFVEVAQGNGHPCAREASGAVDCWGDNSFGQLGRGTQTLTEPPGPVPNLRAKKIALGETFTCTIDQDDGVSCFGRYDLLRDTSWRPGGPVHPSPVRIAGLPGAIVKLFAGGTHACAQTLAGEVYCWGDNYLNAFAPTAAATVIEEAQRINVVAGAELVDIGGRHTCTVANGVVRCFGELLGV